MSAVRPDDSEWVTWPEAAKIVGCPVPTIDWYTRSGRIETRPHKGRRPSVNRASIEEFASWWQPREGERARKRAARAAATERGKPPTRGRWLTTKEAGQILGLTSTHALRVAKVHCRVEKRGTRWWVNDSDLRKLAQRRTRWISYAAAARLVGCAEPTITKAVRSGRIRQRTVTNTAVPSLDRQSVVEFAQMWRAEQRARSERRARKRAADGKPAVRRGPPDDGRVWLDTTTTALLLGLSRNRIDQLALEERLPHMRHNLRRWFRRDHVEQVAAARAVPRRSRE